ncbi:primosomal protein N' [Tahibacter amnicola]|uniref:Replication restart protein PriA n=1 Tax=Tahibacter amnicola TaxID=2976241 RepID=A0ABY6BL62_9GAMM|nr:primosomal protein N' [Tahibacter amnicola]UXI70634.1 primosomal protein N' [Tahibacter amnicola]
MPILKVAVPVPLPQVFDYRAPRGTGVRPGCRVEVPFGRDRRVGVVVGHASESDVPPGKLKPVTAVLDETPLVNGEWLATLQWASRYYQCALGIALETALPVGLRQAKPLPFEGYRALALSAHGRQMVSDPPLRRGSRVRSLFERLAEGPVTYAALDTDLPGWRDSATALRHRGFIETVSLSASAPVGARVPGPPLNPHQTEAIGAVTASFGRFQPWLLEGVTGSGKTEVYLGLVEAALARDRQALVLVPEIGLTPQTLRRFRDRFGPAVHALHSGLAEGERSRAWLAAARGDAKVILGTRSAIFAPLPALGLIAVDEEHDASYKQQDGFRYSARDLALVRARALSIPVVLGSATASLESLANAESGRYARLTLPQRAGAAKPPTLHIVDQRRARLVHGLAPELVSAIKACVQRGEQALIFRNRRGYAPVLLCHDCGWHADCERCNKPMTFHRGRGRLVCHHCEAERRVPVQCPECHGPALQPQGQGTERLEESLGELFPGVPVIRVDRETTRNRGAMEALLDRLGPHQSGIYVGTQMLAKGHDLPNLTLVAILGVDEGLHSVDFRASERLGQLVVQVSGRAGRAHKPGAVYLQTHHPDHALLAKLLRGGYRALAESLLAERRAAELPPFAHLALLRAEAKDGERSLAFLNDAAAAARETEPGSLDGIEFMGPFPAPMPLRAGLHRFQLIASSTDRARLQACLPRWLDRIRALPSARQARWSLDVDPIDLY